VQGVGFRWFAEREAAKRNVRGYVRNLPDGRVEIWAQSESEGADGLEGFFTAVDRGPSAARVERVERTSMPVDETLSSFEVRFSSDRWTG
jgi:acylphosphatase